MFASCYNYGFKKEFRPQRLIFLGPDPEAKQSIHSLGEGYVNAQNEIGAILKKGEEAFNSEKSINADVFRGTLKKQLASIIPNLEQELLQNNITFDKNDSSLKELRERIRRARVQIDAYYKAYREKMKKNGEMVNTTVFDRLKDTIEDQCISVNSNLDNFFLPTWTLKQQPQEVLMQCEERLAKVKKDISVLRKLGQHFALKKARASIGFLNVILNAEKETSKIGGTFSRLEDKYKDAGAMVKHNDELAYVEAQMARYPDNKPLVLQHRALKKLTGDLRKKHGAQNPEPSFLANAVKSVNNPALNTQNPKLRTLINSTEPVDTANEAEAKTETQISANQIPELMLKKTLANARHEGQDIILTIEGKEITLTPDPDSPPLPDGQVLYVMKGYIRGFPATKEAKDDNGPKTRNRGKPLRLAAATAMAYVLNLQRKLTV